MKINVSMCESDKNFQQSITNNQFCYNIKSLEFQQSQRGGGREGVSMGNIGLNPLGILKLRRRQDIL